MAVGRILPRVIRYARLFAALAAVAGPAACTAQKAGNSGDHFNLRGRARRSWSAAAEQVCGFRQPISGAGGRLKEINERHIAGSRDLFARKAPTPADADHRVWRALDGDSVEIFVPGSTREEICQAPAERPAEIPSEPSPTAQPDAGAPDAAVPDAGIEAAAPTPPPTRTHRPGPPRPPQTGTQPTPAPTPAPTSQPVVPL